MTSPELELPAQLHQTIRGVLIREAAPNRRSRLARGRRGLAVVAAGAAVVLAAGTGLGVGRWLPHTGSTPSATTVDDGSCDYSQETADDALFKGLGWVAPAPSSEYTNEVQRVEERWCSTGTDPVVTFIKRRGAQRITDGVTVWRSLAPNMGIDPQGVADGTADLHPTDQGDPGTVMNPPSAPIIVRGVAGRSVRGDIVTWTEDGQRWSLTGSVGLTRLISIAGKLRLGDKVSWPSATESGFEKLAVPAVRTLPEGSWQGQWRVCYSDGDSQCSISLIVRRSGLPWQAGVTDGTFGIWKGRQTWQSTDGDLLRTQVPGGAQLELSGRVGGDQLTSMLNRVRQVS